MKKEDIKGLIAKARDKIVNSKSIEHLNNKGGGKYES